MQTASPATSTWTDANSVGNRRFRDSLTTSTVVQGTLRVSDVGWEIETADGAVVTTQPNAATRFEQQLTDGGSTCEMGCIEDGDSVVAEIVFYAGSAESTILKLRSFGGASRPDPITVPAFHAAAAQRSADFWLKSQDPQGGVFANLMVGGGPVPESDRHDKWTTMTSRNVAGNAFAFQLTGKPEYLEAARSAAQFLAERGTIECRGKSFLKSRQLRDGSTHPAADPLLNIFEQTYGILGWLRLYAVSGDPDVQRLLGDSLNALASFRDPVHGGLYDAIEPSTLEPVAGTTDTKSFTSSADVSAAVLQFATELGLSSAALSPRESMLEVARLLVEHHVLPERAAIAESFDRDWLPNTSDWRNPYATVDLAGNLGATAKVGRMLIAALPWLDAPARERTLDAVRGLVDNLMSVGAWDSIRGAAYDVISRESPTGQPGEFVYHSNYVWWVQEQFVILGYLGWFMFGERRLLEMARSILRFWHTCFVCPSGGVYDTVDHQGNPVELRMARWVKNSLHELELPYFAAAMESIASGEPLMQFFTTAGANIGAGALPTVPGYAWRELERESNGKDVVRITFQAEPTQS